LSTGTITFAYDGDEQRIRKTTPDQETLYFGDLYERVTEMASGTTAHRYYVHSPERAVAIVTRGGTEPGTRYLHVEHLGSVDGFTLPAATHTGVQDRRGRGAIGRGCRARIPLRRRPAAAECTSSWYFSATGLAKRT
jgi:hypothetical protein